MTRGGKKNRRSKEKGERNEQGLQTGIKFGANGAQEGSPSHSPPKRRHAARTHKRDGLTDPRRLSLFAKKSKNTDGSANVTEENMVHKLSMPTPPKNRGHRGKRGKGGDPAARTAKRAMRRAKKAALEAAKNISVPNAVTPIIEVGHEAQEVQESAGLDAAQHEDPITLSATSATSVAQSVLIDISRYIGYDGDQARLPLPLSHLKRLASLIPRQHTSPQRVGCIVEGGPGHKGYFSLLVAKAVDDFCSYVGDLLEQ